MTPNKTEQPQAIDQEIAELEKQIAANQEEVSFNSEIGHETHAGHIQNKTSMLVRRLEELKKTQS